jgi:hypothetical protein
MRRLLVLVAVLAAVACTGPEQTRAPDAAGEDNDASDDGAGGLPFGAPCQTVTDMSTECASGACQHFNMFPSPGLCTLHCTTNAQCPAGSMGQKCNTQGYCRP